MLGLLPTCKNCRNLHNLIFGRNFSMNRCMLRIDIAPLSLFVPLSLVRGASFCARFDSNAPSLTDARAQNVNHRCCPFALVVFVCSVSPISTYQWNVFDTAEVPTAAAPWRAQPTLLSTPSNRPSSRVTANKQRVSFSPVLPRANRPHTVRAPHHPVPPVRCVLPLSSGLDPLMWTSGSGVAGARGRGVDAKGARRVCVTVRVLIYASQCMPVFSSAWHKVVMNVFLLAWQDFC